MDTHSFCPSSCRVIRNQTLKGEKERDSGGQEVRHGKNGEHVCQLAVPLPVLFRFRIVISPKPVTADKYART